ncbi:MAG: hypothetical protein K8S98_01785 [Planctomycetes bacterium]|nr:hypothetical protein [Planctomycetota bacterium]
MVGSTRDGRKRRLGCASKLAISFAAFALGLVACEVYVRVAGLGPPPRVVFHGGLLANVDDPVLRFENRPGALERIEYRDTFGAEPRFVEMRVNDQGFRGPLVSEAKPDGTFRVACVGDSHTFGFGCTDDEAWPAVVARELGSERAGQKLEVLNCGVHAYDTMQEALWLEKRVLSFAPDLVVLQYYINDTAIRGEEGDGEDVDWLLALTHERRGGVVGWLRKHSRFAEIVLDSVYCRRGLSVFAEQRMGGYRPDAPGWLRVTAGLRRVRDDLVPRGIRFVVVLYPFLVREGDHLSSHAAFEKVRAFCASENIACFDAEPAFAGRDVDDLRISLRDFHANPEANGLFGRAVAAWLVEKGFVP